MQSGETALGNYRTETIDEALKGQRPVEEIAAEAGMSSTTLKSWLAEHYQLFPDDPRHHLIAGESQRDNDVAADEEDSAREDMAKNKEFRIVDDKTRNKILARVANMKEGESKTSIAAEFGVHGSTITYWQKKSAYDENARQRRKKDVEPQRALPPEVEARRQAFFADARAGMSRADIKKKHDLGNSTVHRWWKQWEKLKVQENRRAALAKAREVRAEMMKDPTYREQQRLNNHRNRGAAGEQVALPMPTDIVQTTQFPPQHMSTAPTAPPRALPVIPPSAAGSEQQAFMVDSFKECVEERQTLRGMVKLLQREAEQKDKKLDAYRRLYGEIAL